MRTFVATWLPGGLLDRVDGIVEKIRRDPRIDAPVRWVKRESMHLTLQFFGDVDPPTAGRIEKALEHIDFEPFRLTVRGVGFFPREKAARVFWAGVTSEEFSELAARIHERTSSLGFEAPAHPLTPHLTLARAKGGSRFDRTFIDAARGFREYEFGSATIDRMVLVESRLRKSGSEYVKIAEYTAHGRQT